MTSNAWPPKRMPRPGAKGRLMMDRTGILALLDSLAIRYRLYEHKAIMTIAEAENIRNMLDGPLCKCLLLTNAAGDLWLLSAHGDCRVNMGKLGKLLGSGRLSFAPPEALEASLGCKPGSATILGLANDTDRRVTAILQGELTRCERDLHFHPMENTASLGLAAEDLIRFLEHVGHSPVIAEDIDKQAS